MDRVGYAPGLIRYATERELAGGTARYFRPRVLIYGGVLALLAIGFAVSLFMREPIGLDVLRDRNALYRILPGGDVENVYSLRILNKDDRAHRYVIETEAGGVLRVDAEPVEVSAGEVQAVPARIRVRADDLARAPRKFTISVRVTDIPGLVAAHETRFFVPETR